MSENSNPTPPVEPTPPGYDAPAAGVSATPSYEQPVAPSYEQPAAPSYQQPVAQQPNYSQQPVQQSYGQQPYQQGAVDPANNVTLNYWLSVFFSWIPALIFFLVDKGKNSLSDEFHRANLNFSILRAIVGIATSFVLVIPVLGIILAVLLGLGSVGLFIIHIMAAIDAPKKFREGQPYKFPFTIEFIK